MLFPQANTWTLAWYLHSKWKTVSTELFMIKRKISTGLFVVRKYGIFFFFHDVKQLARVKESYTGYCLGWCNFTQNSWFQLLQPMLKDFIRFYSHPIVEKCPNETNMFYITFCPLQGAFKNIVWMIYITY